MLRFAIGLIGLAVALPAAAQTVDTGQGRLEIAGQAPAACLLRAPAAANGTNATFASTGATSGEVRIVQLVDGQTAQPRSASIDIVLPVICNTAHSIALVSANGGLLRTGGNAGNRQSPTGFGDLVGYEMTVGWAGRTGQALTTTTNRIVLDLPDGGAGGLNIGFRVPPGGGALTAGQYGDSVTVELRVAS